MTQAEPQTAPPASFNLAQYVLTHQSRDPDKVALIVAGARTARRITYRQLEQMVRGTATGLRAAGLAPGARLLLRLDNTLHFPIAYLGAIAAGYVPIVSSAMLTAAECDDVARVTEPQVTLAAPGVALPQAGDLPVIDQGQLEQFFALPPSDYAMGTPDRPGYVVMTSGTQSSPRAVLHAHRAIWARRMMWQGWEGLRPTDRMLHAGAFNWTYTLGTGLLDPWAIGATAIVTESGLPISDIPTLAQRHGATIFAAAPGVFRKLLRAAPDFGRSLRHALSAGEKLPTITRDRWRQETGTDIHEAFGMSECSTFISGSPDRPVRDDALGWPQAGRRVALMTDGQAVPPGEVGEIAIAQDDPGLMLGYLGDAAASKARFANGYFLTGDMGRQDESGAIHYLGRNDDMLNAGGYRVSPSEIEKAMARYPGVEDCAAVDHAVSADTKVIALFYTGTQANPDKLAQHAHQHLARYKQPRIFVHLAELPRGANNKVSRRRLRETVMREMQGK